MSSSAPTIAGIVNARVKGRTRIAVAGLFRNRALARSLERALLGRDGIRSARVDARTGNVLLEHSAEWSGEQAAAALAEALDDAIHGREPASPAGVVPVSGRGCPSPAGPGEASDVRTSGACWHARTLSAVLEGLEVASAEGLGIEEAEARLARFGHNVVTPEPERSELALLLDQFLSLPVAMLGGSIGVSLATRSFLEAAVTAGVVVANAGIGYGTESGARRLIGALTGVEDLHARVIRGGHERGVAAKRLVPGDVLVLRRGDPVPADALLLESEGLSVNESLLTGESMPQLKEPGVVLQSDTPLAERRNMVFMGTTVAGGSARAVVVDTGDATEIGRVQRLAGAARAPTTPIERDLDRLGRDLALGAIGVCVVAFLLGAARGHPALRILKGAIALAVAAVPEGLPTVATSTLALGLGRMRRQRLLVRRLDAVESLGSVQTLCLDKTGTLTENRMTVTDATLDGTRVSLMPGTMDTRAGPALERLASLAVLATETPAGAGTDAQRAGLSGTEQALVDLALRLGIDLEALQRSHERTGTRLRDDRSNFVMVSYRTPQGPLLAVKGRPGEVLDLCGSIVHDGWIRPLDEAVRRNIRLDNERLAADGLRVLGVAYAEDAVSLRPGGAALTWCGLLAMQDPVRPGCAEALAELQRAGIRTVMITGDQGATAVRVAEAVNLAAGEPLQILDAVELARMDAEVLSALAAGTHVFARVSPAKKLEIVQALQRAGQVVAMTGDGINDGPALKAADVGIAMGRQGARIATDVADVVIEDDDLSHLVVGVREGRTILANIRKSIHFLLATNLSEIFVVFAEILRGPADVESPMELFWINLVTDVFPSLGLALEPAAADVMARPPRHRDEPLVDAAYYRRLASEAGIIGATTLAAHGYGLMRYGPGPATRGVTFLTMVSAQLLHALTCRSDRFHAHAVPPLRENPTLIGALGVSTALQVLPFAVPPLRRLLGIAPLKPLDLAVAAGASAVSFAANQWLLSADESADGEPEAPRRENAA